MNTGLELTKTKSKTDTEPENGQPEITDMRLETWIDFVAVGGLVTKEDGTFRKMSVDEFAAEIDISKTTLYAWRAKTKDFWERVKQRRLDLGSQVRLQKVYNGLYLKAAAGDPQAVKLYLQIFDGWKPPAQAIEHEVGDHMADIMKIAQARRMKAEGVQEGEVVDDKTL